MLIHNFCFSAIGKRLKEYILPEVSFNYLLTALYYDASGRLKEKVFCVTNERSGIPVLPSMRCQCFAIKCVLPCKRIRSTAGGPGAGQPAEPLLRGRGISTLQSTHTNT